MATQMMATQATSVYLDYNATTPMDPDVLSAVTVSLKEDWCNPSSGYPGGQKAKQTIANARIQVANMINASPSDIIFNSGGTESNYATFYSIVKHWNLRKEKPHIIYSSIDHHSVKLPLKRMEDEEKVELTVIKPFPGTGRVSVDDVLGAVRENTALVTVMLANNETGVIQPVGEICSALRKLEADTGRKEKIFVHTDAAQAFGKIPVDITTIGVDYLTIVGHKFYGPRIGALYVRGLEQKCTPYHALFLGGSQERGYRSGTENTGMIAGLGKAAELVTKNIQKYNNCMQNVKEYLVQRLKEVYGDRVHFNGDYPGSQCLPNTCNVSIMVPGHIIKGNSILNKLKRCVASSAAACHSQLDKPSQILLDSGVPEDIARGAIRLSVGRNTSKEDIDVFMADLEQAIAQFA